MATATKAHNQKSLAVFFSLSEDQILVEGSTKGFEHFVLEKRFPFAENCDEFWVVIPKLLKSNIKPINERFRFLGLFDLIRLSKLGPIRIFSMFFKVLKNQKTKVSSKNVLGKKRFRRLLSDLLITTLLMNLHKRNLGVRFLVGTNSFLSTGLPTNFSLRSFKAHRVIIWYSINSIPIIKKGQELKNYLPADFVREVDEHFVWD